MCLAFGRQKQVSQSKARVFISSDRADTTGVWTETLGSILDEPFEGGGGYLDHRLDPAGSVVANIRPPVIAEPMVIHWGDQWNKNTPFWGGLL